MAGNDSIDHALCRGFSCDPVLFMADPWCLSTEKLDEVIDQQPFGPGNIGICRLCFLTISRFDQLGDNLIKRKLLISTIVLVVIILAAFFKENMRNKKKRPLRENKRYPEKLL